MPWTDRVCYAVFYVCVALKNMLSVQMKSGIMDTQRRSAFTSRVFFCTKDFSPLCFVLSMVLRLDAEHIENKPNVGH